MPRFLEQRFGKAVATTTVLFWLGLYVVVNLTSILYLGALAIGSIAGLGVLPCMLFLAAFATVITLGGMKVIGYTDVIQVTCLVVGCLVTTRIARAATYYARCTSTASCFTWTRPSPLARRWSACWSLRSTACGGDPCAIVLGRPYCSSPAQST
jgi:Na+(H+)/acetate symporter ActP